MCNKEKNYKIVNGKKIPKTKAERKESQKKRSRVDRRR